MDVRGQIYFFVICEWTWHHDAMPGSVQNMMNTMLFIRSPVLGKLQFEMCRGMLWVSLWEVFGDLGFTFSHVGAYREMLEF